MIRTWRHKGLEEFYLTGKKKGIQPHHANKLSRLLAVLNAAAVPEAMNLPGFGWHPLDGDLAGHWAVSVNGNWRVTYSFEGGDAILVDYQDYH
ncbi:type II toxin-antitoxin system RelE/ParE family toxin [Variovorax sp. RB3P1]|uniref:type II toxin-antitoxin system RelE/ParE family toxin n=1 Tax=Variovorax TaxID=34072 RepID=UPI00286BF5D3|nr:type II toxin-antitoxin system RelE/ParE family toxin [Variovorax sp. 3319]